MMKYDQETRDLARLAADRTTEEIMSVLQLCESEDQAVQVALMAAGSAFGTASGAVSRKFGYSYDEANEAVPELIKSLLKK